MKYGHFRFASLRRDRMAQLFVLEHQRKWMEVEIPLWRVAFVYFGARREHHSYWTGGDEVSGGL